MLTPRLRIIIAVVVGTLESCQSLAFAQPSHSRRTLSLDSRYFLQEYSNKAIGHFGIEMIQLGSLPTTLFFSTDSVSENDSGFLFYNSRQAKNFVEGLALLVGSSSLSLGFHLAYHELGHGTRFAAMGLKPLYGHGNDNTVHRNFFSYYVSSLFDLSGWTFYDRGLFPLVYADHWDGLISAGGVNNTMFFAEMIEDEIQRHGGHIGFATSYVLGKLSPTGSGPANDIGNVLADYRARGFRISRRAVTNASVASFFLSSMTYQFAHQFIKLFLGESTRFHPWEFYGVQLPNTEFYLTRAGLSYKVRTGYSHDSWRFPVAVEFVGEGSRRTEVGLGAEKKFNAFSATIEFVIGNALECEFESSYAVNEWLLLSGGYSLFDVNNLHGERMIPSLEHGSKYHEAFVKLPYVY